MLQGVASYKILNRVVDWACTHKEGRGKKLGGHGTPLCHFNEKTVLGWHIQKLLVAEYRRTGFKCVVK